MRKWLPRAYGTHHNTASTARNDKNPTREFRRINPGQILLKMINVDNKKCRTESCGKQPSFGVPGTKIAEYCKQHAPGGMVDVKSKRCKNKSCGKFPRLGVAGTKTAEYCKEHAPEGMVDVKSGRCKN